MPDYANTYFGRPPGEMDEELKRKKLQALFQGGMQGPQDALLKGADIGLKKSVFGGGTKAPDLFGGGQHAQAATGASQENPYAGLMKGLGGFAAGMAAETPKRTPGEIASTPSGEVTTTPGEVSTDRLPTRDVSGEIPIFGPEGKILTPEQRLQIQGNQDAERIKNAALGSPDAVSTGAERGRNLPPTRAQALEQQRQQEGSRNLQPPAPGPTAPQTEANPWEPYQQPGGAGRATPMGSEQTAPALKGSRKTLADIEAAGKAPAKEEPKWWKRFGKGAQESLRAWTAAGQPGGGAGAFGALLGGGLGGGVFNKKGQAEAEKQAGIEKLWKRYGSEMDFEKGETAKSSAETSLKHLQNKFLIEGQEKDEVRTPEEAAKINALGIPGDPYEGRKTVNIERDGTTLTGYPGGPEAGIFRPNRTIPVEKSKEDYEVTVGGQKLPAKPAAIIGAAATEGRAVASRTATAENQKKTRLQAEEKVRSAATAKAAGAQKRVEGLRDALTKAEAYDAEWGTSTADTIRTQLATAEGELTEGKVGSLPTYDQALEWMIDKGYDEAEAKRRLNAKGKGKGRFYQ